MSFGGIAGPQSTMDSFDRLWRRHLRKAKLPKGLSMKEALRAHVALSERIPAHSATDRIRALEPFAACIREHPELSVAIALDVDGVAPVIKRTKGRLVPTDNPHMIAFAMAMYWLIDWSGTTDRLSLICDDEQEMALPCYDLYRRLKVLNPEARQKLACLSFADDEVFLPLQGADMLASLIRLEALRRFFGQPYEYAPLYELIAHDNPRLDVAFLDERRIIEMGESLMRRKASSAFVTPS